MKKIILGVVSVLAGLIIYFYFLSSNQLIKRSQSTANSLIVGVNANFQPFEFIENGKLTGFEIELVRAIGDYLHQDISFKDMAFDALLLEAQMGRIQLIAGALTPTPERAKQLLFTKPYLDKDPLIVITRKTDFVPQKLADLAGTTILVNDGYTAESFMAQQSGITLRRIESPAEAFFALQNDTSVDAFVSAQSAVQPFFDKYGVDKFNILQLPVADNYALAISKRYPELFEQIEKALEALHNDGTILTLKKKWHLDF